jgi:hypothetical protein
MSFGWTGFFRQGAWFEFRRFILNQRRDVLARVTTINAELARIGSIQIIYERSATDHNRVTERRIGMNVTPNTSIEHLLRAYIAQGGNPFDISMFLTPDSFDVIEETEAATTQDPEAAGTVPVTAIRENQPYGGIAASGTTDPLTPGLYMGGWLPLWRYPSRRFGNTVNHTAQSADMTRTIHAARGWVTQEIRTLRNDIEARIIKLMDLREQLTKERDELLPTAVGGSVPGLNWSSEGEFATSHNVAMIVENIDSVFYPEYLQDGSRNFNRPRQSGPNPESPMLLDDAPNGEEDWTSIG